MTLARRYQVAGNAILILGGFMFVAIFVLAATHPIPDWLRSTMLATAVTVFVSGLMLRGFGGLQLNLDTVRDAVRFSKDACETGEMMLEHSRLVLATLREAPTVRVVPMPVQPPQPPPRRHRRPKAAEGLDALTAYTVDMSQAVQLGRDLERRKRDMGDGQVA